MPIDIHRLTSEYIDGGVAVLRQVYFPSDPLCLATRLLSDSPEIPKNAEYKLTVAAKEVEVMAEQSVKDGVSFVAVDNSNREVIGVIFNKIIKKPKQMECTFYDEFLREYCKEKPSIDFFETRLRINRKHNAFEDFDVECVLEILFLAVSPVENEKELIQNLLEVTVKLAVDMNLANTEPESDVNVTDAAKEFHGAESLKMTPKCVTAILSNSLHRDLAVECGLERMGDVALAELQIEGLEVAADGELLTFHAHIL